MTTIGSFFDDYRHEKAPMSSTAAPKRDVEIDPFDGLAPLITELGEAADYIVAKIKTVKAGCERRDMGQMRVASTDLHHKTQQLLIMAETLQRVTGVHKDRGVK